MAIMFEQGTFYLMHNKMSVNIVILEVQITEVQISDFPTCLS